MSPTPDPLPDESPAHAALAACGATILEDPHGPQALFESPAARAVEPVAPGTGAIATALQAGAVALLADWGIVSVSGADAVKFLHAQTTNDIEHQAADEARWNGYCTPKGRLLATGLLWRDGSALHYAVSRQLAEPLRKRLSMFVLRAKAKVGDRSANFAILGLTGKAAPAALHALGIQAPAPMRCARAANDSVSSEDPEQRGSPAMIAIGLEPVDGSGGRWWLVVPLESLPAVWQTLSAILVPVSTQWWRATEILAGQPRVVPATTELFVPQTLNWELIDGVSFRKGCYPGQEIVARMHYRGKPKRRTFLARLADVPSATGETQEGTASPDPAPGSDVFAAESAGPVGVVVMSAPAPAGGTVLLYEAPIDIALQGGLRTVDGRALEALPLPYPIASE